MTDIKQITGQFQLPAQPYEYRPFGNGHINDTFELLCRTEDTVKRFVLQTVNGTVFREPVKVMQNIEKVTTFLKAKMPDSARVLQTVSAKDGNSYFLDEEGCCWRIYEFIEQAICPEQPDTAEEFYECGVAFGEFQKYLNDFPATELYETIPDFHNTPKRYESFLAAVEADVCDRAKTVQAEIAFLKERAHFYPTLFQAHNEGKLPLRVTHNDTKINNVMLDATTKKAVCVIDLDTVMPGFSVNDFGDAIRYGANTAAEDETDLSKVTLDLSLFEAYVKGFIEGCGGLLLKSEIRLLPEGAKMLTLEQGLRFLEDYLKGDTYFRAKYPEHNLHRCRTQLKLAWEMEQHWQEMREIVDKYI